MLGCSGLMELSISDIGMIDARVSPGHGSLGSIECEELVYKNTRV